MRREIHNPNIEMEGSFHTVNEWRKARSKTNERFRILLTVCKR